MGRRNRISGGWSAADSLRCREKRRPTPLVTRWNTPQSCVVGNQEIQMRKHPIHGWRLIAKNFLRVLKRPEFFKLMVWLLRLVVAVLNIR